MNEFVIMKFDHLCSQNVKGFMKANPKRGRRGSSFIQRKSIQLVKQMSIKKVDINYRFNASELKSLVSKRPSFQNFEKALSYMKKAQFVLKKKE